MPINQAVQVGAGVRVIVGLALGVKVAVSVGIEVSVTVGVGLIHKDARAITPTQVAVGDALGVSPNGGIVAVGTVVN